MPSFGTPTQTISPDVEGTMKKVAGGDLAGITWSEASYLIIEASKRPSPENVKAAAVLVDKFWDNVLAEYANPKNQEFKKAWDKLAVSCPYTFFKEIYDKRTDIGGSLNFFSAVNAGLNDMSRRGLEAERARLSVGGDGALGTALGIGNSVLYDIFNLGAYLDAVISIPNSLVVNAETLIKDGELYGWYNNRLFTQMYQDMANSLAKGFTTRTNSEGQEVASWYAGAENFVKFIASLTSVPSWNKYAELRDEANKVKTPQSIEAASMQFYTAWLDSILAATIVYGVGGSVVKQSGMKAVSNRATLQLAKRNMEGGMERKVAFETAEKRMAQIEEKIANAEKLKASKVKLLNKQELTDIKNIPKTPQEYANYIAKETGIKIEIPKLKTVLKPMVEPFYKKAPWQSLGRGIKRSWYACTSPAGEMYFNLKSQEKFGIAEFKKDAKKAILEAEPGAKGVDKAIESALSKSAENYPAKIAAVFNKKFEAYGLQYSGAVPETTAFQAPKSMVSEMEKTLTEFYSNRPGLSKLSPAAQAKEDVRGIVQSALGSCLDDAGAILSSSVPFPVNMATLGSAYQNLHWSRQVLRIGTVQKNELLDRISTLAAEETRMSLKSDISLKEYIDAVGSGVKELYLDPLKLPTIDKLRAQLRNRSAKLSAKSEKVRGEMDELWGKVAETPQAKEISRIRQAQETATAEIARKEAEIAEATASKSATLPKLETELLDLQMKKSGYDATYKVKWDEFCAASKEGKKIGNLDKQIQIIDRQIARIAELGDIAEAAKMDVILTYIEGAYRASLSGALRTTPDWMVKFGKYMGKYKGQYDALVKAQASLEPRIAELSGTILKDMENFFKERGIPATRDPKVATKNFQEYKSSLESNATSGPKYVGELKDGTSTGLDAVAVREKFANNPGTKSMEFQVDTKAYKVRKNGEEFEVYDVSPIKMLKNLDEHAELSGMNANYRKQKLLILAGGATVVFGGGAVDYLCSDKDFASFVKDRAGTVAGAPFYVATRAFAASPYAAGFGMDFYIMRTSLRLAKTDAFPAMRLVPIVPLAEITVESPAKAGSVRKQTEFYNSASAGQAQQAGAPAQNLKTWQHEFNNVVGAMATDSLTPRGALEARLNAYMEKVGVASESDEEKANALRGWAQSLPAELLKAPEQAQTTYIVSAPASAEANKDATFAIRANDGAAYVGKLNIFENGQEIGKYVLTQENNGEFKFQMPPEAGAYAYKFTDENGKQLGQEVRVDVK